MFQLIMEFKLSKGKQYVHKFHKHFFCINDFEDQSPKRCHPCLHLQIANLQQESPMNRYVSYFISSILSHIWHIFIIIVLQRVAVVNNKTLLGTLLWLIQTELAYHKQITIKWCRGQGFDNSIIGWLMAHNILVSTVSIDLNTVSCLIPPNLQFRSSSLLRILSNRPPFVSMFSDSTPSAKRMIIVVGLINVLFCGCLYSLLNFNRPTKQNMCSY